MRNSEKHEAHFGNRFALAVSKVPVAVRTPPTAGGEKGESGRELHFHIESSLDSEAALLRLLRPGGRIFNMCQT